MKKKVIAILAAVLLFGVISDAVIGAGSYGVKPDYQQPPPPPWNTKWEEILKERSTSPLLKWVGITAVILNAILLLALLIIYLHSFRKTKSYFTLALSFFIGVLLMQKIMFFYFPLLPQLFETVALAILLVLSLE